MNSSLTAPGIVEARNTRLVGYHDLDGRPAFKLGMHVAGGRRYVYAGSMFHPGWSVIDVTDPEEPKLANFIPGPPNTWTIQMQVAESRMVVGLEHPAKGWTDLVGDAEPRAGVMIWDLSADPVSPKLLSEYPMPGTGTHRNFYAGGDIVALAAALEGYQHRIAVFLDISDPSHPREVSRWWWPGQHLAGGETPEHQVYMHGPAYIHGNRAYLSYGRVGMVVLDISDIAHPQLVSRLSFGDLGSSRPGCHSVVPIPGKQLLVVNSEAHQDEPGEVDPLNYTFVVQENGDDYKVISAFPMPRPANGLPYKNYYEKGERFGPHNQHHHQGQPWLAPNDDLVYMTYFNAGLRIFSIEDPFMPEEVGHFVPEDPKIRRGPVPAKLVTQFEDVLVDDRGYVYCSDKQHGLFVLRYEPDGSDEHG